MGARVFAISPVGISAEKRTAFWRGVVQEWAASGLSAERFARSRGVSDSSVLRWARLLGFSRRCPRGIAAGLEGGRSGGGAVVVRPNPFVPVRIVAAPPAVSERRSGAVEVVLNGHRRIALVGDFDANVLRRAVLALETLPC